jgi:hypothetical protein
MARSSERKRIADALQYVSNAITASRDPHDPDRNGTVALWLSRALNELQGELPDDGSSAEDRAQLAAAQAVLEDVWARLRRSGHRAEGRDR